MAAKKSRKKNHKISLFALFALLLLFPLFGIYDVVLAAGQQGPERPSGNADSNSAGDGLARHAANRPALPPKLAERVRQATELRLKWRLAEAETVWREVLTRDEANTEALIGLAEIERTRFNYIRALEHLNRATVILKDIGDPQLMVAYGSLYLTLEEPDKAAEYFRRARGISAGYPGAILGEAGVALLKRDYSRAEKMLEELLRAEPNRVEAYIGLARVYLGENRNTLAAQAAQRALDLDKYNVDAMATLCYVRVAEKRPDAVRKLAKSVLELNHFDSGVRRLLSQYLNSKKAYQIRLSPEALSATTRADNLKDMGKYQDAITEYRYALASEPRAIRALLGLGACEMALNNYSAVTQMAERALQIDPDNALAHLQLSLAHNGMHEQARIQAGATDWRNKYFADLQEVPKELADIFINYNRLSRAEQHVIEQAVAPLANYIKELKRKGAKHHLLAIDKKSSEVFGYESLENRMTFDGRYYASVRGFAGLVTVSGVEYLDAAMRGGFNTIAHEFAHQVHTLALPSDISERIKRLYQRALKDGRVLDYYAASNEWEYFAQGYEAYVSNFKRPNAGLTARHTREELQQQDPDLFSLFEELAGKNRTPASPTVTTTETHIH
ncbi:MAG: tetratricopeptide repeat protein [Acidobacteriota bacterium]